MEIDSLKNYNPSMYTEREQILFGASKNWEGERTLPFKDISVQALEELIELDLLVDYIQGKAPTLIEYIDFMKKYPGFTAHGFATNPDRDNPFIAIEGLEYRGVYDIEVLLAFTKLCRKADVFETAERYLYCWFD